MKPGKLTIEELKSIVFPYTGIRRPEVMVHAAIGEDCAVADLEDRLLVVSTDPITGAAKENGYLGVHVSCNDVIASGGRPLGILVTLLMKEGSQAEDIRLIVEGIHTACMELGIEIMGGHTEITQAVRENILSFTAIGTKDRKYLEGQAPVAPGDEIILTKGGAIEGSAILYNDYPEFFRDKVSPEELQEGQALIRSLSVAKEGLIAMEHGARVMHDVTEGGILGGVYEMAEAAGLGVLLEESAIHFPPPARALGRVFPKADLLRLISSGSLLITAPPGNTIREALKEAGIDSFLIGHFREEGRVLVRTDGSREEIGEPRSDELWTLLDQLKHTQR